MTRAVTLVVAVLTAACLNREPGKSDTPTPAAAPRDAAPAAAADLPPMLQGVMENLDKPGPYEAPLSSPAYAADKPHWAVLPLSGSIAEIQGFSWTGGVDTIELREVVGRLRDLAAEPNLTGVILRVEDFSASLPDALELHAAFGQLIAAGKKLHCHTESVSNAGYVALTACERLGIAPLGEVVLSGPALMPVHVKELLDDLDIKADFLHIGAYKGAAEPLTRDEPSEEMEETLDAILDAAYRSMVDAVAASRKLSTKAVEDLIDRALFPADAAVAAKLVDVADPFERFVETAVADQGWVRVRLERKKDDPMAAMMQVAQFLGAVPTPRPTEPHVALVYAVGSIVDGDGEGLLGARETIASRTLVPALAAIAADDRIKAVVLRIDSGGGSARASELIWRAVAELKARKPVVVSMSDFAASGGYYIACGATRVFAQPNTLTGSIGVVGGKLAPGKALRKLGITTFPMGRGKRATMFARLEPWTSDERDAIRDTMKEVYDTFVQRVAAGRSKTVKEIDAIAQGRVWTGARAKELGLVDDLGGLDAALAEARRLGGVADTVAVEVYPPAPRLRDFLVAFGAVSLPSISLGLDTITSRLAQTLSPVAASILDHTLTTLLSFRTTPIQTVTLVPPLL
jgi:protease IV